MATSKSKRIWKTLLTVFSLLMVLLLLGAQLLVLLLKKRYFIHYIYNQTFYGMNVLIVLFICLAIIFWFSKKQQIVILSIAGGLVLLQLVLAFMLADGRTFLSVSPNGANIFEMKQDKQTGVLTYERNIYYFLAERMETDKLPKPTAGNGYLLLSQAQENLKYAGAKNYRMTWLNNDACVFTYQTKDGSFCQYVRGYGRYAEDAAWQSRATDVIGNWQGEGASLAAAGATYQLMIDGKTYNINPEYSDAQNASVAVFDAKDGGAVCTMLVSGDKLLVVLAENSGKVYSLTRR